MYEINVIYIINNKWYSNPQELLKVYYDETDTKPYIIGSLNWDPLFIVNNYDYKVISQEYMYEYLNDFGLSYIILVKDNIKSLYTFDETPEGFTYTFLENIEEKQISLPQLIRK